MTDIFTYRAAIAAKNTKLEKLKIKIKMASNSIQMKKGNSIKIII